MKYVLKIDLINNPVPYKRTTQRAKYKDEEYKRYRAFKELLKWEFRKQNKVPSNEALNKNKHYEFSLKIGFKNRSHGDGDNIVKGVLDALFENDKNVLRGSYEILSFKKAFIDFEISEYLFLEKAAV